MPQAPSISIKWFKWPTQKACLPFTEILILIPILSVPILLLVCTNPRSKNQAKLSKSVKIPKTVRIQQIIPNTIELNQNLNLTKQIKNFTLIVWINYLASFSFSSNFLNNIDLSKVIVPWLAPTATSTILLLVRVMGAETCHDVVCCTTDMRH